MSDAKPMTAEELAEARALEQAATPGPWTARGHSFNAPDLTVGFCNGFQDDSEPSTTNIGPTNASFVAASRTLVPHLLAEVERLTRERDEMEAGRDRWFAVAFDRGAEIGQLTEMRDALVERVRLLTLANEMSGAIIAENEQLRARIAHLEERHQSHLETIARISQTTPLASELEGWEGQRAAMIAEVGTLRARVQHLEADLAFARQCIANADEVLTETAQERDAARADLVGAIRPLADRITALTLSPHAGHLWSELCRLDSDLRALINSNTGSDEPKGGEGT